MDNQYTQLYEKLSRLQWLLQKHHFQKHAEHGPFADPTRGQGRVLAMLRIQSDISTKDLSYLLGIRQQSLNELLNKLEKAGYVTRTPSESDRRIMIVGLTQKGKETKQETTELPSIFDCLSEGEQQNLGDYLDRIITALEEQLGAEGTEETERWMNAARSRMGNEVFDKLMRMKRAFRSRECNENGQDCWDNFGDFPPDNRGPAPDNIPGAERFDPNYSGQPHRGRRGAPSHERAQKKQNPQGKPRGSKK